MDLIQAKPVNRFGIHPQKFALWAALGSITMMFASLTSAYVVRKGAGNWLEYQVPNVFFAGTLVLLISSLALHASYKAYKSGNEKKYKYFLIIAFILGVLFTALQYTGWIQLNKFGVQLNGNPSGSFFYVISGIHVLHVLGGIAALSVALIHAFTLSYRVTEKRRHRFELVCHYWHFVDVLWIYLLTFMIFQQ